VVDWAALARQKILFVYIKATQGSRYFDPTFSTNWNGVAQPQASGNRVRRGAYHFMTASDPPDKQAQNFLSTVGTLGTGDLPPCLDVEWDVRRVDGKLLTDEKGRAIDAWAQLPADEIVARISSWLKSVETATGKKPIIYTNKIWWKQRVGNNTSLASYPLWIADYTSKSLGKEQPSVPGNFSWSFWQLTDKGTLKLGGIEKPVDTTIYNGTTDHLEEEFGFMSGKVNE
jgi:lysozyme